MVSEPGGAAAAVFRGIAWRELLKSSRNKRQGQCDNLEKLPALTGPRGSTKSFNLPYAPNDFPPKRAVTSSSREFVKQSSLYQEFLAEREEILEHKWLESKRLGYDIGFQRALLDWIRKHRKGWRAARRQGLSGHGGTSATPFLPSAKREADPGPGAGGASLDFLVQGVAAEEGIVLLLLDPLGDGLLVPGGEVTGGRFALFRGLSAF